MAQFPIDVNRSGEETRPILLGRGRDALIIVLLPPPRTCCLTTRGDPPSWSSGTRQPCRTRIARCRFLQHCTRRDARGRSSDRVRSAGRRRSCHRQCAVWRLDHRWRTDGDIHPQRSRRGTIQSDPERLRPERCGLGRRHRPARLQLAQEILTRFGRYSAPRGKLQWRNWVEMVGMFVGYLIDEDRRFVGVPSLDSYRGQREIREQFAAVWKAAR